MLGLLAIPYAALSFVAIGMGVIASATDPTDPTIKLEGDCEKKDLSFHSSYYEYNCIICDSCVLAGSKHCAYCNRCVSGFDHHNHILNNCIGEQNHDSFIKAIHWMTVWFFVNMAVSSFVVYAIQTGHYTKDIRMAYT